MRYKHFKFINITLIIQCFQPLNDCYETQELKKFKGITLRFFLEVIKLVSNDAAAKFENCQKYKDAMAAKGSIAGIKIGILIALFSVIAYFGI